jgi:hypothetical protein
MTPPEIDGAASPHLIADSKAIPIVFRTIAVPQPLGPAGRRRFLARVSRMRLSPSDQSVLERELARLHEQLMMSYTNVAALREFARNAGDTSDSSATIGAANDQLRKFSLASYDRLAAELSSDGAQRLRAYVDAAKLNIKVYPSKMQ